MAHSKHDDDLHDKANQRLIAEGKRIETEPIPGVRVGINLPEPAAERLHRIPCLVTSTDRTIIRRAVTLCAALLADLDPETAESTGRHLGEVCRFYLVNEREHRKADHP